MAQAAPLVPWLCIARRRQQSARIASNPRIAGGASGGLPAARSRPGPGIGDRGQGREGSEIVCNHGFLDLP